MDENALANLGDLSDELSAKVAQLQAALAEVENVSVLDPGNIARLEESYASSSDDEEEGKAPKKKTRRKKTETKSSATRQKQSKPGRPKGSRTRKNRVRARAAPLGAAVVGEEGSTLPPMTRTGNAVTKRTDRHPRGVKQTDSMKSYLKDIGTVSLLTAKQEVELAKRIQDLMYLDGVRATLAEELEREPSEFEWAIAANIQEEELERRLEDGKRAKNQMIQANLRLVVSIAKRYANKSMSFQDLIQEGCVGLIRGAEKFDFKRGYKFSTYAHWWREESDDSGQLAARGVDREAIREQVDELPGSHPGGVRGSHSRRGEV